MEHRSKLEQQRGRLASNVETCERQIHALKARIQQEIIATTSGLDRDFALKKNEKTIKAHYIEGKGRSSER